MVVLQRCRWKFSHTKKLCSRLYSIEVDIYFLKTKKSLFEPPVSGFRGNVRTPPIARWKALGRLSIHHNHFLLSPIRLRRYKRKPVEVGVFRRGGSLLANISEGRGRRPLTTVGIRKLE